MKVLSKSAISLLATLLFASCSSEPDFEQMSVLEFQRWRAINEFGLTEQHPTLKALEDGYASIDEYERGWAAELACYEDLGYVLGEITTSKLNGWEHTVNFTPPKDLNEETAEAATACQYENTVPLILVRKTNSSHEDRIDPPLLADAQACLNVLDTPPKGTEVNIHELLDTTNDAPGTMDCLLGSWSKLYPDDQQWHGVDVGKRP